MNLTARVSEIPAKPGLAGILARKNVTTPNSHQTFKHLLLCLLCVLSLYQHALLLYQLVPLF